MFLGTKFFVQIQPLSRLINASLATTDSFYSWYEKIKQQINKNKGKNQVFDEIYDAKCCQSTFLLHMNHIDSLKGQNETESQL